jgi:hypothetical protein
VAQRAARSNVIEDNLAADRLILDLARLAASPDSKRLNPVRAAASK